MKSGAPNEQSPVLSVRDLCTVFGTRAGDVHAVNSVNFELSAGEILGVVGESGSGKTVTMMSMLRLLPSPPANVKAGTVHFEGRDLLQATDKELRRIRGGRIGFIFQDPMTSLNPVFSVGFQLRESLRRHLGMSRKAASKRSVELLEMVGIPDAESRLSAFPHQFSGGMRQRVMIAIALACDPSVLIADEPTTALDVTIQAQILELIRDLRRDLGMAIIWITHDLGVIAGIANRVLVMYAGQIVEHARVEDLFANPSHPYTRALISTVPAVRGHRAKRLNSIEGQAPTLLGMPNSCPFESRCSSAFARCAQEAPHRMQVGSSHDAACFLVENASHVATN
ncbi:MAG: ABC transporter ATP-binding protein [Rhodobacteraceae bacterium]|nr:ABC transporter ATP-binding protein [Paracoccaceae bacterium]